MGPMLVYGVIGLAAGLLGSLVGAGGGFLMVPLLTLWTKAPQHEAQGSSLAAIPPLALAGALVYAIASAAVDLRFAVLLGLGATAGGYAGARLAGRLPDRQLRMVAAVVFAVVGVKQLVVP